jgi:hypothetical protein
MADTNTIATPVDVVQLKLRDLAGAQAVGGQKHQDGVVAQALRGAVIPGRLYHRTYLLGAQRRGDRLESVEDRRHHAGREVALGSA